MCVLTGEFEAPADGTYSWGTNSTGAEIESFTDPLTLTETIYIYDQAGVGTGGNSKQKKKMNFSSLRNMVSVQMISSHLTSFVPETWPTSVMSVTMIRKSLLKVD